MDFILAFLACFAFGICVVFLAGFSIIASDAVRDLFRRLKKDKMTK